MTLDALPPELPAPDGMTTTRQLCRLTRLTYRELHYAVARGWLPAANGPAVGSGQRFLFDEDGVRAALVFACLRRAGIAADVAADAGQLAGRSGRELVRVKLAPGVTLAVEVPELLPVNGPARPHR